ncbi:MAG: hypothetical protein QXG35_08230 [Nitrososphaerota archaeon]
MIGKYGVFNHLTAFADRHPAGISKPGGDGVSGKRLNGENQTEVSSEIMFIVVANASIIALALRAYSQ